MVNILLNLLQCGKLIAGVLGVILLVVLNVRLYTESREDVPLSDELQVRYYQMERLFLEHKDQYPHYLMPRTKPCNSFQTKKMVRP